MQIFREFQKFHEILKNSKINNFFKKPAPPTKNLQLREIQRNVNHFMDENIYRIVLLFIYFIFDWKPYDLVLFLTWYFMIFSTNRTGKLLVVFIMGPWMDHDLI